ncbi:hypothetical protein [Methylobacterium fujisawaense]|uniref:hypothetical protein n=1 Tax=Methylobacterium fujisawaense TaxID=107400 RepID=UPI0024478A2D|nr:hypothetical protein [Methylobacterium fujisawaense]MDH3028266.1 hypothetical protein [Methylobacterium fujisawaense]
MFINSDALAGFLRLLWIAIVLLGGVIVAHLVWVSRVARCRALASMPLPTKIAIVGAAFAAPVVGFYAVEIASWHRRQAARPRFRVPRHIAVAALLTLALAAAGTLLVEGRAVPEDRSWWRAAGRFEGQVCVLLIGQMMVFMILRVFLTARRPALLWIAYVLSAAILAVLLA